MGAGRISIDFLDPMISFLSAAIMATFGEEICLAFLHIIGYQAASRSPLCGSALFLGRYAAPD